MISFNILKFHKFLFQQGRLIKLTSLIKQYLDTSAKAVFSRPKPFTDQFTEVIDQIKKKNFKAQNPTRITYKPRYAYTGYIKKYQWKPIVKEDALEKEPYYEWKVKFCMLLGYSGGNYVGMQMQRNAYSNTIEEYLLKALLKNEWMTKKAYKHPHTIEFQRASRTDKGVSAARQCCSLLLRKFCAILQLAAGIRTRNPFSKLN